MFSHVLIVPKWISPKILATNKNAIRDRYCTAPKYYHKNITSNYIDNVTSISLAIWLEGQVARSICLYMPLAWWALEQKTEWTTWQDTLQTAFTFWAPAVLKSQHQGKTHLKFAPIPLLFIHPLVFTDGEDSKKIKHQFSYIAVWNLSHCNGILILRRKKGKLI